MNFPKSHGFGPTLPAGAPYPKKVQVVRNRDGHLMGFHQRGRSYVVGFQNAVHVKQACETMGANSRMWISNHIPYGSAYDEDGVKPNERKVNGAAHFYLEKRRLGVLNAAGAALARAARKHSGVSGDRSGGAPAAWSVKEMAFAEFVMLPFRHNLGVVLPTELMLEDRRRLIFLSTVLDPCQDPVLFRPTLIR